MLARCCSAPGRASRRSRSPGRRAPASAACAMRAMAAVEHDAGAAPPDGGQRPLVVPNGTTHRRPAASPESRSAPSLRLGLHRRRRVEVRLAAEVRTTGPTVHASSRAAPATGVSMPPDSRVTGAPVHARPGSPPATSARGCAVGRARGRAPPAPPVGDRAAAPAGRSAPAPRRDHALELLRSLRGNALSRRRTHGEVARADLARAPRSKGSDRVWAPRSHARRPTRSRSRKRVRCAARPRRPPLPERRPRRRSHRPPPSSTPISAALVLRRRRRTCACSAFQRSLADLAEDVNGAAGLGTGSGSSWRSRSTDRVMVPFYQPRRVGAVSS